jgi:DDE superfamily endonuclease
MVNTGHHVKPTLTIMVWGAIWMEGGRGCKSKLVFMERDSSSPRNGYTANSYIKALEEGLLPIYDETRKFVQDNARVHTARKSISWLQEHHVALWDWPPHSPDLNPIEHCWAWMKSYMRKKWPESAYLKKNQADAEEFKRRMTLAWEALPERVIRKLIQSLANRCFAVWRARGGYTKY